MSMRLRGTMRPRKRKRRTLRCAPPSREGEENVTRKSKRVDFYFFDRKLRFKRYFQTIPNPPGSTSPSPFPPGFLPTFLTVLPRELREQIYTHIIGYKSSLYTIQPPNLVFRNTESVYLPVTPIHLLPPSLLKHPGHDSNNGTNDDDDENARITVVRELTMHFLALNIFFLRYRYNDALTRWLTLDALARDIVPGNYVRRLQVMVHPPQSAEDERPSDHDEDREYEWRMMFPVPRNAKCKAYRRQLEGDLVRLGEVVDGKCSVEVLLFVDGQFDELAGDGKDGDEGVMREWLGELAGKWRDMGKMLSVKTVDAEFLTRELSL